MTRVAVITLGCEKNTVDSERYLAQVVACGAEHVSDPSVADLILVNTCGFIDAAKKESLDAIIEAGKQRVEGNCRAVVAVGCMVERHREELEEALPEVDLFLGSSQMDMLVPELRQLGLIDDPLADHPGVRVYSGSLPHLRYLKASEGCDHGCAFCAIPLMRGKHRSFPTGDLVHEAQLLELQGAREVNLVAQDLAHYGRDVRDGSSLTTLMRTLLAETSIPWFRLLYLYSAGITPALLETMASSERLLPYLDMPIQHASDLMLRQMRRPERAASIRERVALARSIIPGLAIRTTCIVGFPGETPADFELLLDFLEEMRFDSVGCFTYSPQEGTRAWQMADDVDEGVKRERQERVSELQRALASEKNEQLVGKEVRAIVDGVEDGVPLARGWWQAHELDGVLHLDRPVPAGTILRARLDSLENDYDLRGTIVEVTHPAAGPGVERMRTRSLPLAAAATGSYGR